ncbi:hypothetical protein P4H70_20730 [Paenibacillus ehimensis]|uniref:HNH endonuclease n=1 Tax=Paenibacillus ehimensis TaxID=79264 RepID=UPI002DB802B9|nr:hypothetical protein [Paenibacillus ehimensis]MEC0211369.1 hypothetical protein [Paenibacillus ehimensis]
MNMIVNPKDPIVRYAILEAHKGICYYSKNVLNMFNMTIDHIIPTSCKGELKEIEASMKKRNNDFEFNHLYNLVPATWDINNLKGDQYDAEFAILLINKAKEKAKGILKRIDQLRKFKDFEKYLSMISSYLINSNDPKQEMLKFFDLLPDQFGPFEELKEVTDHTYFRSETSVKIMASLPQEFRQFGSCCFEFRSAFISDCMITLNHKQIIEQLFVGLNTAHNYEKRGFVDSKHYRLSNMYYIQLGNNRFLLNGNEVDELCKIIDDFGEVYISRFKAIEENWGTLSFNKFDPVTYSAKLVKIKRYLWKKMMDFSWEFDFQNGVSEWHIFNRRSSSIMIYRNHTVFADLEPEKADSYHDESYMNPDDTLWIVWKRYKNPIPDADTSWSAEQTYSWLTEKFIPYVIYYYDYVKKKKSLFEITPKFEFFLKEEFKSEHIILDTGVAVNKRFINGYFENIQNANDLLGEIYALQLFLNSSPKINISNEEIRNIFFGIRDILLNIEIPDYSCNYIGEKIAGLNKGMHFNQTDVIALIKSKLEHNDDDVSLGYVEGLLKCYIEALKSKSTLTSLKKPLIYELINLLKSIWNKYYLVNYIVRIGGKNV